MRIAVTYHLIHDFVQSQYWFDENGRAKCKETEATRKDFNIVLIHQDNKFFISELIDHSLQDNVLVRDNFFEYIYHIGCAINLHFKNSGFIPGGQNSSMER